MGARATGGGVELLKTCIRLRFMWQGKRRTPKLAWEPTPRNEARAHKLMDTITTEIKHGVFIYERYFPDEVKEIAEGETLATFGQKWLTTVIADIGTKRDYKRSLDRVWNPTLGEKRLVNIRYSELMAVVATRMQAVSGKTVNNDLIVLRQVFKMAVADGLIARSPAATIKRIEHQSPAPDPFTPEEMMLILADLRAKAPEPVWAYYQFAFATGIRPSEQIIARWTKFSQRDETLLIDTARTHGREKSTKTNKVRTIELTPPALEALIAMKPHTFLKGPDATIFMNPRTGRPWTNDEYQRITYFHPALKRLGIRSRDAYQTRHTFATLALMSEETVNAAYVAEQMGHTSTRMFFKVYSRWIHGADKGRQRAKLAASWPGVGHGENQAQQKQQVIGAQRGLPARPPGDEGKTRGENP
jgi:integrase